LPRVEHGREVARQTLDHAQPHVRIALAHRLQQRQREHARSGRSEADADVPCQPRLPCGLGGGVGMADRELCLAEEGQSRIGREHTGGGALQQPRRQLALEAADLLAQRRRANAQIQRGAAHAA